MDHRIASARLWGRTLTATFVLAVTAALVAAPVSYAQAPKTKAKPAAQKSAQKPAAQPKEQAAAPNAEQPELMYSPWMKVCGKANANDPNSKNVCVITKDGRLENGMPVAVVQLFEPEGSDKKLLRVTVPLGMQLQHGTRVIIDQGQPMNAPYSICFPAGCLSDYEANADMVNKMKKGHTLTVQAINMRGAAISLPLPLTDFAKAYDGPPTDPKAFEEQQRKLQEALQKKAAEAQKKLESQHPAAAAPATPQKK
ncbi:MAG TPA: invasion associated locus B family protein [Pseudolabrys sp.]|nr:invasion associated locus B family protein [Pseudolabrys sp.]